MSDQLSRPARRVSVVVAFVRQAHGSVAALFLLCVAAAYTADVPPLQQPELVVDMRSDATAMAQLFFDVGRGMNQRIP